MEGTAIGDFSQFSMPPLNRKNYVMSKEGHMAKVRGAIPLGISGMRDYIYPNMLCGLCHCTHMNALYMHIVYICSLCLHSQEVQFHQN